MLETAIKSRRLAVRGAFAFFILALVLPHLSACGDSSRSGRAVSSVTPTATATPVPPVSLELRVERTPGMAIITADLSNSSGHSIFYLAGCSALCRPQLLRAVSFRVFGPDGAEVFVKSNENPFECGSVLLCPEGPSEISAGESVEETLQIDGTAWKQASADSSGCGPCTSEPFEPGRYTVTASSSYAADPQGVFKPTGHVEATVELDWPSTPNPVSTATTAPTPTPTCASIPHPTFQIYGGGSCRSDADCPPPPAYLFSPFCWTHDPSFGDTVTYMCPAQPCLSSSDCPAFFDCASDGGSMPTCRRRQCAGDADCDPDGYCVNQRCYDTIGTCAAYAP